MSEIAEVKVRERFVVDNDMKAEWCLDKIRKARAKQNREKDELKRQMSFYEQQIAKVDQEADEEVAFFESMLLPYFTDREDAGFVKDTKTKASYKLPTGELILKHREPEFKRDEPVTIKWLKENNMADFVKTKTTETLDWAGLKNVIRFTGDGAAVDSNGEIIPGVTAVVREDEFVVEVK